LLDTLLVHYLFDQPLLWRRGRWCPVVGRDQTAAAALLDEGPGALARYVNMLAPPV